MENRNGCFSASFGDYDLDGDLDLFLTHWGAVYEKGDTRQYLWENDGTGIFSVVPRFIEGGCARPLAAAARPHRLHPNELACRARWPLKQALPRKHACFGTSSPFLGPLLAPTSLFSFFTPKISRYHHQHGARRQR